MNHDKKLAFIPDHRRLKDLEVGQICLAQVKISDLERQRGGTGAVLQMEIMEIIQAGGKDFVKLTDVLRPDPIWIEDAGKYAVVHVFEKGEGEP